MNRGAWQATVHGVTRVGHDLVTKPPPPSPLAVKNLSVIYSQLPYLQFYCISTDSTKCVLCGTVVCIY